MTWFDFQLSTYNQSGRNLTTNFFFPGWLYNLGGISFFKKISRFKLNILTSDIEGMVYVIHI